MNHTQLEMLDQYYTVGEVAKLLNVHEMTVRDWYWKENPRVQRAGRIGKRIYLELNGEPSTAKVLAITLRVSRKTIESQLLRMCVKELVSKVGKGLYVVPKEGNLTR
jgi:Mn-dependent DtxR family transcriptional regulator